MTGKEFRYVLETIEQEGFDYAFVNYSDFDEIKDEEFHKIRLAFLAARKALTDYIGSDL